MAQFDFPSSPSTNQTYTSNGVTFKWDGVAWRRITSTGAQGAAGAQGASGTNGAQGASGTNGAQGATGAQGLAGTAASQGAQGASGTNGAQGATGSTGAQGASNIVNVKDYGATGDGNTDDRAAIQSAINAARVVFFPAGTYKVGAALTVWHSNSALIGHESLSAEIKVVGTGYSGPPISVQSAADNINEFSRIENLRLFFDYDGGGPATFSPTPNETNCGISINGSLAPTASATNRVLRFKMENCRVIGFSNGINLKETTNTLLKRIFIEHHTDNSSSVTHTSSNIYCGVNFDCTPGLEAGISPQASVELHQVVFNGSGAPANTTSMGFRITGQDPRDIFFEGCETAHGNYGWFIDPSDDDYNIDIHINRPIIDAVDNTGIYVKDWNGYGALTINGGYVVKDVNTTGAGIWVENSRGVNITGGIQVLGVSIKNAPGATSYDEGIRIKDSKLCSVSSSTIMNCQYGVSLQDSSNCTVTGNIIGAETGEFVGGVNPTLTDAIRIFGNSDTNTITGNTIKGANTSYKYFNGIIIAASTCEENMISSNAIDSTTVTNRISDAGVRTNIFDRGAIGISTATGGQLLVGGGTGAAVQFNDVNTRLEIPASNTLAAFTSNLERLRIDASGNVQIGTNADAGNNLRYVDIGNYNTGSSAGSVLRLLTVKSDGSSTTSADIVKYKTGGLVINNNEVLGTTGFISFGTGTAGGSVTERLRIASDGVITAQKSATFGNTSDSFTSVSITSSTSGISELRFADTTANAGYVKYEHTNNALIFATDANEKLRITSTGQLNLVGNMQFTGANPELEFNNGGPRLRVPAANTLAIHNGGTIGSTNSEIIRIGSSGQIGLSGANYGTAGQVLTSQGSGSAPTWTNKGTGAQGATGSQGATGAQGSPGTNAGQGAQGSPGTNGAQGSPGTNGAQGSPGTNGAQGQPGAQGNPGAASFTSISGTPSSYTARKYLRVNSAGTALEYINSGLGLGAVNVRDYGAAGNGSTDDRTSIINAISALGANGGTVYFPPGDYKIGSTITVNGNSGGDVVSNCIRFEGLSSPAQGGASDAGGSELFVAGGSNYNIFNFVGVEAVHMVNLRVRGGNFFAASGSGSNSSNHALRFEKTTHGGNDMLLENMVFCGVTRCVHLVGTGRVTLRKLTIGHVPDASGDIIKLEADSNSNRMDQIRIEGCVIDGAMHPDQDASRNSANGIGIYEHTNTIFISNTSVIRCNYNFYCDSGWNGEFLYFVNSEAERAKLDGFYINGGEFISIDNCFSCSNYRDGIRIEGNTTTSVSITNPNIRINNQHGINHQAGSLQDLSIVNPRIGGNSNGNSNNYSGIHLTNGTHNVYIGGGKSGGDGNLSGSAVQRAGIEIVGTSHDNIRVIGVNVNGNVTGGTVIDSNWGGSNNWLQMNSGSSDYKSSGGL